MKRLLITAAVAGLATTAHAAPENFSHLDLTYISSSTDGLEDGTGIGVELNFRLGDAIFFNVDHSAREFDFSGNGASGSIDFKTTDVGLGYALHLGEDQRLSPYAAVALSEVEFSAVGQSGTTAGFGAVNTDGVSLAVGARFALNERLNIDARYRQINFDNDDLEDETAIRLSLAYALSQHLGVVLRFEQFDEFEVDDIHLGVRALFGGSSE